VVLGEEEEEEEDRVEAWFQRVRVQLEQRVPALLSLMHTRTITITTA
jgi:hypothetical protein